MGKLSARVAPAWLSIPQLETLNLAGRGARQVAPDVDPARIFPRAGALLDMRAQRFEQPLVGAVTVLEHDEGFRLDQSVAVLLADEGGLEHRLMRNEGRLDLERRYPHAVDLEHVVGAPAVVIVAVGVAQIIVAGMRPFADEGAAALRALVPVAFAGGGPAHHELADLAIGELAPVLVDDLHVVPLHRLAGRSVADVAGPVAQKGLQHFGRAEPTPNVDAYDRAPAFAEMGGQRLAGRNTQPQAVGARPGAELGMG